MIPADELVSNTASILPPISNNTLGKTSGALIKQLLENLNGEAKMKPSQLAYQNQSKRSNNAGYHSLPPIGPGNNSNNMNNQGQDNKMMLPKPKNIIQGQELFDKNKMNLNFRDQREV